MGIIYDDNPPPRTFGGMIRYDDLDACKLWATHYKNYLFLRFIAQHAESTWLERQQANKEIPIAQQKMDFWRRHQNWDQRRAEQLKAAADRMWIPKLSEGADGS